MKLRPFCEAVSTGINIVHLKNCSKSRLNGFDILRQYELVTYSKCSATIITNRTVSCTVKALDFDAGGPEFNFQAGQSYNAEIVPPQEL